MFVTFALSIAIFLLYLVYINGKFNERYWKKREVYFYKKNKVLGLFWDYLIQDRPMFQIFNDLYKQNPDKPAIGFGSFMTPSLYVKDPLNIEHVLKINFHAFNHRGFAINEHDKLAQNVLMLNGPKWKIMRQSMSPLFTTSKLKSMYYIIDKSAQDFVQFLKNNPEKLKGDCYQTVTSFCCAAISGAVFGIGSKSTFESPIIEIVKDAFKPTIWNNVKFTISLLSPWLFKTLHLTLFSVYETWFIGAIKKVIRTREQENTRKHDFVDICVNLQKIGTIKDSETGYEVEVTDEILAAQAFFFFLAGVEPCATTLFTVMVELGKNPDIMKRVHEEIDTTFEKYKDKMPFEALVEMEYLDKVIQESLRLYPPIGYLTRQCVEDTILPVGNIQIEKGSKVYTPLYEVQTDSRYFENPEEFNPDRFSRDSHNNNAYMPFGKGNRICIGKRYAKLQIKAGLVHLLRNFTVNTLMKKGGIKYKKEQVQLRVTNVDLEWILR